MKRPLLLPLLSLWLLSTPAWAQIHGRVFSDHNANGRLDQPTEAGIARVEVSLHDRLGQQVASTRTDSAGYYRFPRLTAQSLRLQFASLPADHYPTGSFRLVRFVRQADEGADLGIYQPALFVGDQPKLAISIQPLGTHADKRSDSLGVTAIQLLRINGQSVADTTLRVKPALVGSIWGLAHDAYRGRLYAAALAKRHSGFGPLGSGGIYQTDLATGQTTPLVSLDALGIPTGPAALKRDLSAAYEGRMLDSAMFSWVGKMGLGGLDLATDGATLYTVNLFDGHLYGIRLPAGQQAITRGDVTHYTLPTTPCQGGSFRPFAVKYHQDKVYVGGVCDAAQSGNARELRGLVYALDPLTRQEQLVADLPLDYPRGAIEYGVGNWFAWTDKPQQVMLAEPAWWAIHPQPMLADLEFTADGSLVVGLMDRLGHQMATGKGSADGQWQQTTSLAAGDILRTAPKRKAFRLEANARVGEQHSAGADNAQGPGGGEFYFQDTFTLDGVSYHQENSMGGLAVLPGRSQLLASSREPVADYNSAGVSIYDNQTGHKVTGLLAYRHNPALDVVARKTNHVGDVELLAPLPPTLLGTRVWQDCDEDGEQDADETGLPGIEVGLWAGQRQLAQARTDQDGQVQFNSQQITGGLQPGQAYELRIAYNQPAYGRLSLTATAGPSPLVNNDAVDRIEYAVLTPTPIVAGVNQVELAAGFRCVDKPRVTAQLSCSGTDWTTATATLSLANYQAGERYALTTGKPDGDQSSYATARPIPSTGRLDAQSLAQLTTTELAVRILNAAGCFQLITVDITREPGCRRLLTQLLQTPEGGLQLSPNPTRDKLTVHYPTRSPLPLTLTVTGSDNRPLQQEVVATPAPGEWRTTLSLGAYPPGLYIITLQQGETIVSGRVLRH